MSRKRSEQQTSSWRASTSEQLVYRSGDARRAATRHLTAPSLSSFGGDFRRAKDNGWP